MLKKLLEKQIVFEWSLRFLAPFSRRAFFDSWTRSLTGLLARLNVLLNRPKKFQELANLGQAWLEMMPPDGQKFFKVYPPKGETVEAEIHLHCPLRGTGDAHACYKLMNYDRQLMDAVGGQLVVLESQSNSGNPYCKLAIRRKGESIEDLQPAHLNR